MSEGDSDRNVSRRGLMRTIGGIGVAALSPELVEADPDERVRVNVGYGSGEGRTAATEAAGDVVREFGFDALTVTMPARAARRLRERPSIRYVERDGRMRGLGQTVPWGVDRVDADDVHAGDVTGDGADVAIVDTGIDATHPDLEANLGEGKAIVDCTTDCDVAWDDDNGHGTHCAGVVGAVDDDGGVVGVAPEATLHAVKVLDDYQYGSDSEVAAGIEHVGDQGWDVASLSLGGRESSVVRDACKYAHAHGVLLVAAAGNDGPCSDCVTYPAAYSMVTAVSATDDADDLAGFSASGPEVELAAPGKEIYSTFGDGHYRTMKGTSAAAAHVAGAGGLLMANGYSDEKAHDRLKSTAEDLGLPADEQGSGLLDVAAAAPERRPIGEVGKIKTDQPDESTWHSVSFDGSYDDPVAVMKPATDNGENPVHVRLRNVTSDGFEFQLEEWNYQNGPHVTETVSYLVVETGEHTLSDGTTVEASRVYGSSSFTSVDFSAEFDSPPAVLTDCTTVWYEDPVVTRQRNVTADGFELKLQEEEAGGFHGTELAGYVAIEVGTGQTDGGHYETGVIGTVSDDVTPTESFDASYGSPAFLADVRTYNGNDTCNLRYRNLDADSVEVLVEEEMSEDYEMYHADEQAAYAVFEDGTKLYPAVGEVGTVATDQPDGSTWHSVEFDGTYEDPVVVAKPVSYEDNNPCHVRLRNVAPGSFEFKLEEWSYLDGSHATESVSYLVVEAGRYELSDGTTVQAGTATVDEQFTWVPLWGDFDGVPATFANCQTFNGTQPVVTRQRDVTTGGLDLRLQEEEAADGSHAEETVGYVAIEMGYTDHAGGRHEADVFRDVPDAPSGYGFDSKYNHPAFLADLRTYNGGNTCALRYDDLDSWGVELFVDEERSGDDETGHVLEDASYAVFEDGTVF